MKRRPLRIVHVIAGVHEQFGGPSTCALKLNKALDELGHSATLLTTDYGFADSVEKDAVKLRAGGDVRIYRRTPPAALKNSLGLAAALWRHSQHADGIHIHGQYLLPNVFAYAVAKMRQVPYGVQPHGTLEPYQRAHGSFVKKIFNRIIGQRILQDASYVCFASQSEADRASDVVSVQQKLVLSLGASLDVPEASPTLEARLSNVPRESCFLFLGRFANKKRPEVLLQSWKLAQDRAQGEASSRKLILAGPDDDMSAAYLKSLAAELGISESVEVVGPVYGGQKAWLLQRCGTFVLASENENFAIAVVEAMLAGAAVIVSDQVAAAEHVKRAGSPYVLADTAADTVSDALLSLMLDPVLVKSLGSEAHNYAKRHLSWTSFADGIAAKFERESVEEVPVSAIVLTKNESAVITRTVEKLRFCNQIIVFDSDSTDATTSLAREAGAEVVNFRWNGKYPKKKQWALEHAAVKNDWVFFVDADEYPSDGLVDEIRTVASSAMGAANVAYDIPLAYSFMGKRLRFGHRVSKRALLRKSMCEFPEIDDLSVRNMWEVEGHYQPICNGKVGQLAGKLHHEDLDDLYDYFSRHNRYSDWEAFLWTNDATRKVVRETRSGGGRVFDVVPAKPVVFFAYSYFGRLGFLDGRHGFHYAVALSFYYWQCGIKKLERSSAV